MVLKSQNDFCGGGVYDYCCFHVISCKGLIIDNFFMNFANYQGSIDKTNIIPQIS